MATRLTIPAALRLREVAYAKGTNVNDYLEQLILADLDLHEGLSASQEQLPMTG